MATRIAGSAGYFLAGCATPLDVQHGRLGRLGEHREFPQVLYDRRRRMRAGDESFEVPSPDDHLVLQGMQRVYGRTRITLADIAYTIRSLRHETLDWTRVLATARAHGVAGGLSCYLTYVEQIHRSVFGSDLLPTTVHSAIRTHGWGRAEFRGRFYRYPTVRVAGTLYLMEFGAHVRARRWTGAGRLFLLPALGAAAVLRKLAGALTPIPAAEAA